MTLDETIDLIESIGIEHSVERRDPYCQRLSLCGGAVTVERTRPTPQGMWSGAWTFTGEGGTRSVSGQVQLRTALLGLRLWEGAQ
jgi:hypothetical protein